MYSANFPNDYDAVRRGNVMALPPGSRAVNLGCGVTVATGWINIDNSPNARLSRYPWLRWALWKLKVISTEHYEVAWPRDLLIRDLRAHLPFQDGTIDYVYSSHVLEHLSCSKARSLVSEVYRILRPGGLVRFVVPDLRWGIQRYLDRTAVHPPIPRPPTNCSDGYS